MAGIIAAVGLSLISRPAVAQRTGPPIIKVELVEDGAQESQSRATKILFVGQSILFVNDAPQIFAKIVKAKRPQEKFLIEMVAGGGYSLKDHYQDGSALKEIQKQRWNYVVLAESTMNLIVIHQPFELYAPYFDREVRKVGAEPLMFECYDECETDDAHSKMHLEVLKVAAQLKERIIPVGATWRYVHQYYPLAAIFGADRHHPSPLGAYLIACVTYSMIYGESAEGADVTIENYNQISRKVEVLDSRNSPTMINLARAAFTAAKQYRGGK
ncbi:MAG: hypothetical protein KGS72_08500 [Cyanobacteria bacterium REEB67]|nr:hypothetical protein [Cyanobacteria bacterium REEB67]